MSNYTSRNKIGIWLRIKTIECLVMSFFFSFSRDQGKATLNKNQPYAFHTHIYKEGKIKIIQYTGRGPHR